MQPWATPDGRWVLCYNGEVFNYRALQADLTALGHRLRTDSDTEVVLEAFREWGPGRGAPAGGAFPPLPSPTPRPAGSTWPGIRSG